MGVLGVGGSFGLGNVIENLNPALWGEYGTKILKFISSDPEFIYTNQHLAPHIIPGILAIAGVIGTVHFCKKKYEEEQKRIEREFYSRESLLRDARKGLEYLEIFKRSYRTV